MSLKRAFALLSLALVPLVPACSDTTSPKPPPPPPQIKTVASYTYKIENKQLVGLADNDVYAMLVTSGQQLWAGGTAGVAVFPSLSTTKSSEIYNELNGLPNPNVSALAEYENKIYVGTWGGGIGIYDEGASTWSSRTTDNSDVLDDRISAIKISPSEGLVYFGTNNGVSIYDPATDAFTSFTDLGPDLVVSSVEVRLDGSTVERWYGPRYESVDPSDPSVHGITVSRGNNVYRFTTENSPLPEPRVNDIYYDSVRDEFWVSFNTAGIAEVSVVNKTWTFHTTVNGLPSNTVYSVTGANGEIWAGTQDGLARLKGTGKWQPYGRSGGLQADRVRVVYSDDGSRLWLAFVESGAARVDPSSAQ